MRSYEVAPFFTFHHINAYDTGEKLFVDLISLPDSSHMKSFYLHQIRDHKNIEFPQGNITRLTLDLTSSNAQSGTLSALQIEMPRINADYAGKPYRYIYGLNSSDEYNYYDRIIKIDLTTDTLTGWHQDHCYVSEAVFVPRPNGHAEDDGVLLATILDTKSGTSSLIILSGSNMQLLARIKLPHHIPFTTHSNYFPKQNVK